MRKFELFIEFQGFESFNDEVVDKDIQGLFREKLSLSFINDTLRVEELRAVKLKNLIDEDGLFFIFVNPKGMTVKFAKTRIVNFVPLPDDIFANVIDWRD